MTIKNYTGIFPRQALKEAIKQQEIATLLLADLDRCKNNLEELLEQADNFLPLETYQ